MRLVLLSAALAFLVCALTPRADAAGDPFTVTNIPVDASAASAVDAQTIAINSGRARAWTTLYRRLVKQEDWSKQPPLDDVMLQRLIKNYIPVNERRSTTRYVANMTYVFNADAVRKILRESNIAYADAQASPVLVIPMSPVYQPHSLWAAAIGNPRFATGSVPLVVAPADPALSRLNYSTAAWQDVQAVATRVHAQEAYLAMAITGPGKLTIYIKRLAAGPQSPPIPEVVTPIPPNPQPAKIYGAAADQAAVAIADAWKAHMAVDFNKRDRLLAEVHISSLTDFSGLQQKLGTVPLVTDVSIVAMNIGEARVAITYVGSEEQLAANLTQAGVDLSNDDGTWWLALQPPKLDQGTQP